MNRAGCKTDKFSYDANNNQEFIIQLRKTASFVHKRTHKKAVFHCTLAAVCLDNQGVVVSNLAVFGLLSIDY